MDNISCLLGGLHMSRKSNMEGFTLLEVLASIVILSIIIVSFLSLFPQMALFNNNTKDNLDSVAIAKELLVEMKPMEYTDIIFNSEVNLPTDSTSKLTVNTSRSSDAYLVLHGMYREKSIIVTINRNVELYNAENLNKHEMQIEVYDTDEDNNPSSTVYGFIRH